MLACTKKYWRAWASWYRVWVLLVVFCAVPGLGLAQQDEVIAGGQLTFVLNCAACHGTDGKGDGPMREWLAITPADLTQLSKKNGGVFPFWHIYRVIDGRGERVRGHGSSQMPIWGREFLFEAGRGTGAEAEVRGKILGLVYYLQSLQDR